MNKLALAAVAALIVVGLSWSQAQAATIVSTTTVSVSATVPGPDEPAASSSVAVSSGGGGAMVSAQVVLSGVAYPLARLSLWRNGIEVGSYNAGLDAKFRINLIDLYPGWLNLTIYARDSEGTYSRPYSLPVWVTPAAVTAVDGIVISPTFAVGSSTIKQGQTVKFFGQSVPESQVMISVRPAVGGVISVRTDALGKYSYNWSSIGQLTGMYQVWASVSDRNGVKSESLPSTLKITAVNEINGAESEIKQTGSCWRLVADLNSDCKVDLVDFSILAYWYKRSNVPARIDLQKNGVVDLADFSIMAYYWTS